MSARSKKYFQAFKELQMIERKYDIFPEYERRCKERNTFMDRNAVNKACSETFTLIAIKEIAKYEKEYTICSSTGNIYYVRIGTLNYCGFKDNVESTMIKLNEEITKWFEP
eukprot:425567_1